MQTITALDLQQRKDAVLVDVRTPAEFEEAHIAGSQLFPLVGFVPAEVRKLAGSKPVYVICRSGGRAGKACEKLVQHGMSEAVVLEGGLTAWEAAGLPVVLGRKTISLERQVRIAAGFLVLLGVGLGLAVHPGFLALSAFVGAGLMFAGITDRCGMALLLARMPWNTRVK